MRVSRHCYTMKPHKGFNASKVHRCLICCSRGVEPIAGSHESINLLAKRLLVIVQTSIIVSKWETFDAKDIHWLATSVTSMPSPPPSILPSTTKFHPLSRSDLDLPLHHLLLFTRKSRGYFEYK